MYWGVNKFEIKRYRPIGVRTNQRSNPTGAPGQILLKHAGVPQRGGHQQELRVRHFQERNLPRPPPTRIRIVVKFVHDYLVNFGTLPTTQRHICHNFGSRTNDRSLGVHGGVSRHHAHGFWAENIAECKKLFAHQCFNRGGVETPLAAGHGNEMGGDGNHGFPRTSGCGQNNIIAGEDA